MGASMEGGARAGGAPDHGEWEGSEEACLNAAAEVLHRRLAEPPQVFIVLGSGLGGLAEAVESPVVVPFHDLPGFPPPGVSGHAGRFVGGRISGRPVLLQAGRYHLYEGHPAATVVRPVRLAHVLGARTLFVTNAAGGLDRRLAPGSLLLLDDLLNFQFRSALAGPVMAPEERFPDMSRPFDLELTATALRVAQKRGIALQRGVYAAVLGPSYETPSEVRMLGAMGAHAVGMSTVLEVTVARARGMRVLGVSLVTNPGAGLGPATLHHAEVLEEGERAASRMLPLFQGILEQMDAGPEVSSPGSPAG
jgi:purine-nucleoside phosphorylase